MDWRRRRGPAVVAHRRPMACTAQFAASQQRQLDTHPCPWPWPQVSSKPVSTCHSRIFFVGRASVISWAQASIRASRRRRRARHLSSSHRHTHTHSISRHIRVPGIRRPASAPAPSPWVGCPGVSECTRISLSNMCQSRIVLPMVLPSPRALSLHDTLTPTLSKRRGSASPIA